MELLDLAVTGYDIYSDPYNGWAYAGLIPIIPAGVGRAGHALSEAAASANKLSEAAVKAVPQGHSRVFRAVSEAEYQDILNSGQLRPGPNSLEGKWFADLLEGAHLHGNALEGADKYRVIEVDVPNNAPSIFRQPNLDGRGPATYIHCDDLRGIVPRALGGG